LTVDRIDGVGPSQLAGDPRDRGRVARVEPPPFRVPGLGREELVKQRVLGGIGTGPEFAPEPFPERLAQVVAKRPGRSVAMVTALEDTQRGITDPRELDRQPGMAEHLPLLVAPAVDHE
jgi:hypothetical protein